jgi:hypothetical protein
MAMILEGAVGNFEVLFLLESVQEVSGRSGVCPAVRGRGGPPAWHAFGDWTTSRRALEATQSLNISFRRF